MPADEIRAARRDEAALLSELAFRSKAYWGYDAGFMAACRAELTVEPESVDARPTFLREKDGRPLGFYQLSRLSPQEVELGFLFVEPAAIGDGHGRALLRHACVTAAEAGYDVMVIQGDPNAEPFYRAAGAERVGSKPSDSIPGRELPLFRLDLRR